MKSQRSTFDAMPVPHEERKLLRLSKVLDIVYAGSQIGENLKMEIEKRSYPYPLVRGRLIDTYSLLVY